MVHLLNGALLIAAEAGGEAAAGAEQSPLSGLLGIVPFIVIIVAFFWFTSRSQKKRERQRQEMLDSIEPKDDVVTIGGVHGRVVKIEDDQVTLRIDPEKDVKITLAKSGIGRKAGEEEPEQ
jgi:preprotein translocase subunit YajC